MLTRKTWVLTWLGVCAAAQGCGGTPAQTNGAATTSQVGPTAPGAAAVSGTGAAAATPGVTTVAGAGAPSATTTAAAGAKAAAQGDLPCPVAQFLDLHCMECHGMKPRLGAPVSLINAASFKVNGMSGLPLTQIVPMRLMSTERPMPPTMLLSAAEIAPVVQWAQAGAIPDPNGCAVHDPSAMGAPGTTTGAAAGSGAVGTVTSANAGAAAPTGPAGEGADWPMFGGDLGNTRANLNETKLSVQSVTGLKELWTFKGSAVTATPAVAGGVAYLPTWSGKVYALDARTGMQKWMTALPDLIDGSPSLSADQVFVGDDQGSVHALDRATGKLLWSKLVDKHAEAHLWSSPIYVPEASQVIVGVASGEEAVQQPYSFRGSVVGLDAKTGDEKWRFYTTTGDASSGPGVGVWATVAVDSKRKLAFVGTGNAYSGKAGPHVDSMLALNYETGQLTWSKQFTADDVFAIFGSMGPDFDIGASANVFTEGGMDILGIGIKSGDYVALERQTGNMLWMRHLTAGSVQGGVIASPAYAAGKVFVASNTYPQPATTTLFALDATSGNVVWMDKLTNGVAYGGVVYANGVVFIGTTSSEVHAYDAASGKRLWMATAPDSIAGGPSVANGVLYVPWGYMWTLREGNEGTGGLTAYGLP